MNPQIEQQQNIETSTQQLVNKQTSQNINELLPKIQDPQKKKFIGDLKPVLGKVLNTEFGKQATKYLKKRPDGETSLQNVLVGYSKKALGFANFAFRQPVGSPPYNQALGKLKTMLDKHYNNEKIKAKNEKSKAELQEKKQDLQEIKKEKQTIEKTISKEIKQLKAELATLKGIKEKHKITVSEEEIKTAEQKFGMTETELQQKLDNSSDGKRNDYKQAGYTARSLFSFLITKDKLKSAGAEPSEIEEFGNTMNKIQDELDLHEIKQDFDNPEPIETFSHLSTEQSAQIIKQTDGMQQAVGEIEEVDYDNPDLKLETDDKLETAVFNKAFSKLDDNSPLLAIAENKPLSEIKQAKNIVQLVKKEYQGNDFNADVQEFVKELRDTSGKNLVQLGGKKLVDFNHKVSQSATQSLTKCNTKSRKEKKLSATSGKKLRVLCGKTKIYQKHFDIHLTLGYKSL